MHYQFIVEEKEALPTISIRIRTAVDNLPKVLGEAYKSIMNYLFKIGVRSSGAPYVGYFNMDMQDLDIEVGIPVAQSVTGNNELKPSEIPAGKKVSCLYTGPYSQIELAYSAIMEWIPANGYTTTGICYEFYLNDPAVTPENELLTKIVFLLK